MALPRGISMKNSNLARTGIFRSDLRTATAAIAAGVLLISLIGFAAVPAQAQTFSVIHRFTGSDGSQPFAGVTMDSAGNLYGTTQYGGMLNCDGGGVPGCGVAYKLKKVNSSWIISVLYEFQGSDGDFLPT